MTEPTMNHRRPPKGETWRLDYREYGVLLSSAAQRRAVYARDKGICCDCGTDCGSKNYHADHDRALHALPLSGPRSAYPEILWFWGIKNLRLLCHRCHLKKTIAENVANAKVRRLVARLTGTRRPRKKVPSLLIRRVPKFKKKPLPKVKSWLKSKPSSSTIQT